MRTIEYRGKDIETKEWVYGYLIQSEEKAYIVENVETRNDYGEGTDFYATTWSEIDPKTAGQYIGMRDKNNRQIFENDVIRYKDTSGMLRTGVMIFKNGSFAIENPYITSYRLMDYEMEVISEDTL